MRERRIGLWSDYASHRTDTSSLSQGLPRVTAEPILKDPDATLMETDCLQLWTTAGVSIISRQTRRSSPRAEEA